MEKLFEHFFEEKKERCRYGERIFSFSEYPVGYNIFLHEYVQVDYEVGHNDMCHKASDPKYSFQQT